MKERLRDRLRTFAQRDDLAGQLFSKLTRTAAALLGRPVAMGQFLNYSRWIRQNDPGEAGSAADALLWGGEVARSCVTIVMPCHKSRPDHLESAVTSVLNQTYPNWDLVLVEDSEPGSELTAMLARQVERDPRIRHISMGQTGGIAAASNVGARAGRGAVIAFLDHDDQLHRHALSWVVAGFTSNEAVQLVFTDEDKLDAAGRRCEPYLKPGFNRALLYSRNYINHFVAIRRAAFERVGGFDTALDGAQDYGLLLQLLDTDGDEAFHHVPRIAYHWRKAVNGESFSASRRQRCWDAGRAALLQHARRAGLPVADIVPAFGGGFRLTFAPIAVLEDVSVIIATRDRVDLMKACLEDFFSKPSMRGAEIIVVDNGSREPETLSWLERMEAQYPEFRVIHEDGPFNYSRLVNRGVAASHGRLLLLLNNDVMHGSPGWLDELAGWANMAWVGCVGAALHYADGSLQHGGVVLGPGNGAGHYERGAPSGQAGMFGHLRLARCSSAVTAACLAVRREVFDEVNGFDENQFPVTFSDVDFCLRVSGAGFKNVWTPYASLTHLEGASRGREELAEPSESYKLALAHFSERWGFLVRHDPYVNENLDPSSESVRLRSSGAR